jgi:hypothetical protein
MWRHAPLAPVFGGDLEAILALFRACDLTAASNSAASPGSGFAASSDSAIRHNWEAEM